MVAINGMMRSFGLSSCMLSTNPNPFISNTDNKGKNAVLTMIETSTGKGCLAKSITLTPAKESGDNLYNITVMTEGIKTGCST